jgi:hypothetical protein
VGSELLDQSIWYLPIKGHVRGPTLETLLREGGESKLREDIEEIRELAKIHELEIIENIACLTCWTPAGRTCRRKSGIERPPHVRRVRAFVRHLKEKGS